MVCLYGTVGSLLFLSHNVSICTQFIGENKMLKVTYKGVEVIYWENSNTWVFKLNQKSIRVGSLKKAKNIIDRPDTHPAGFASFPVLRFDRANYKVIQEALIVARSGALGRLARSLEEQQGRHVTVKLNELVADNFENRGNLKILSDVKASLETLVSKHAELYAKLPTLDLFYGLNPTYLECPYGCGQDDGL